MTYSFFAGSAGNTKTTRTGDTTGPGKYGTGEGGARRSVQRKRQHNVSGRHKSRCTSTCRQNYQTKGNAEIGQRKIGEASKY